MVIVTNVEADHLEHYSGIEEIEATFAKFMSLVGEDGTVSVGTQSLVPWETDYSKLEIMADVYLNFLAQVFTLPDDDYVKTRLEFGSDSADRDSLMTAEEKEIISANK